MAAFLESDLLGHSYSLYPQKERTSRDHPVVFLTKFELEELK